jgi:hypothetical protein
MRKLILIITGIVALASAPAAQAATWHSCRGGFDVQGKPSVTNDTFRQIRERGSNCRQARGITQRYIKAVTAEWQQTYVWASPLRVGTFTCTEQDRTGHGNPYGFFRCTSSHRIITFIAAG